MILGARTVERIFLDSPKSLPFIELDQRLKRIKFLDLGCGMCSAVSGNRTTGI